LIDKRLFHENYECGEFTLQVFADSWSLHQRRSFRQFVWKSGLKALLELSLYLLQALFFIIVSLQISNHTSSMKTQLVVYIALVFSFLSATKMLTCMQQLSTDLKQLHPFLRIFCRTLPEVEESSDGSTLDESQVHRVTLSTGHKIQIIVERPDSSDELSLQILPLDYTSCDLSSAKALNTWSISAKLNAPDQALALCLTPPKDILPPQIVLESMHYGDLFYNISIQVNPGEIVAVIGGL
jgi:ABC-type multidrug transport system fused ATPase/permease subunit